LISAGALPQTPLGELTALPRPPSWILQGSTSKERKGRRRGKGQAHRGKEGRGKMRRHGSYKSAEFLQNSFSLTFP